MFAAATIPFLAWVSSLSGHTDPAHYPLRYLPLSGIVTALADARPYVDKHPVIARLDQWADALASWACSWPWVSPRRRFAVAYPRPGLPACSSRRWDWSCNGPTIRSHVFDFGRV